MNEANAAAVGNRVIEPGRARSLAATTSPMPSRLVRVLPEAVTASLSACVVSPRPSMACPQGPASLAAATRVAAWLYGSPSTS